MKASELRDRLTELIKKHGDLPVFQRGGYVTESVEFSNECEGECDCIFDMEVDWCEEGHFIDGIVIRGGWSE